MTEEQQQLSYVYVLTNSAMPGLVKIGRTSADDPEERAKQLYSTGVPVPFDVEYAGLVQEADVVERALHNAFRDKRVNPRREFFRIDPDQAICILELFNATDVTKEVEAELGEGLTPEEKRASAQLRKRRPPLNFEEMEIPIGSELAFIRDPDVIATVVEPKKVLFQGEVLALSYASMLALGRDSYVGPTPFWTYEGRVLQDIYDDTYPHVE